ncbi:MAG: Microbacterium phage Krampus [Pseudomonadota bacterium]
MAERLADWATAAFIKHVLDQHPAPKGPDRVNMLTGEVFVGEKLWEHGIRLQGHQKEVVEARERFIQCAGGWRSGKSFVGGLRIYIDWAWRLRRGVTDDLWGVLADTYSMAQEEMRHLDRLLNEADIPHDFKTPENASWKISFPPPWTAEVVTLTASDVTKIASRPYRGIVFAEAAQSVAAAFENAVGRVSETRGWVMLEGTFENTKGPWYVQMAESWSRPGAMGVFYSLPSWENLVVYPGGREDPEILARERSMAPARFLEKYAGEPTKRSDLVMPQADERFHVRHRYPQLGTSYDPERPVILFSDPGTTHAYATLAAQMWENVIWFIDIVYRWGRTADAIIAECAAKPWAGRVETVVMDFAARQHRAEGPPIVEQWATGWRKHVGQNIEIYTQPVPLHAGYDIHRRCLLNSWPEDEAQRMFNHDGKLRQVTDPKGPRIMFSPDARAPLFGGHVDGQDYAGEYNLHRNKQNREGTITAEDPIPQDDDAIKAISYGLVWWFQHSGLGHTRPAGGSIPWEMVTA